MALVKCSECGAKVSDRAESCPKCACPMTGGQRVNEQPGGITIQTEGRAFRPAQLPQRHRKWVALLVVTALGASSVAPKFTLWLGIIFSALCVGAFIPIAQSFSRSLLRLDPAKKWQSGSRLAIYGMVGFILVISGWIGSASKVERDKTEAKQAAAETVKKANQAAAEAVKNAEQLQIVDQANANVKARVGEAELIWKNGNLALAEQTLDSASKIPNATDFNPVRELRVRIANSVVETLMAEATSAVKTGDIDAAKTKIAAALAMSQPDQLTELRKLDDQIGIATDPIRLRAALMELSNESFLELKSSGKLPITIVSGYEALDKRAITLAKAEIGNVTEERKKRETKRRRERETEVARAEVNRRQMVSGTGSIGNSKVAVISSKLVNFVSPANGKKMQMVIVTLKNTDSSPIRVVDADITSYDSSGAIVGTNNYTIFAESDSSPGIAPGETWTTRKGEGFILPGFGVGTKSKTVKVEITDVQENSGF